MTAGHVWQASHHRAGSVLVRKLLRGPGARPARRVVHVRGEAGVYAELGPRYGVPLGAVRLDGEGLHLLDNHSATPVPATLDVVGVHMIRDPRAMVRSAYIYHLTTRERWANEPRTELEGLTYRKSLASLTPHDGLLRELENMASSLDAMLHWTYDDDRFVELRFEEVEAGRSDDGLVDLLLRAAVVADRRSAMVHLRRHRPDRYRRSDRLRPPDRRHASRGAGRLPWGDAHERRFRKLFGDEFERLGYTAP